MCYYKDDFLFQFWFLACFILDNCSHYLQLNSQAVNKQPHKERNKEENFLMKLYYSKKWFMGVLIVASEVSTLYALAIKFWPEITSYP